MMSKDFPLIFLLGLFPPHVSLPLGAAVARVGKKQNPPLMRCLPPIGVVFSFPP